MITLSKLAAMAHVSVSTASKAFSMSPEVNEQTREMIFRIAREQGCFKKFFSARYPKYVIAVICPEYQSQFYFDALCALQTTLSEYGCEICVASTGFSRQKERELLEYYSHYADVDGIIMIHGSVLADFHSEVPIVTIYSSGHYGIADITCDYRIALEQALCYYTDHGIRDIGFIGDSNTVLKLGWFREVAAQLGLSEEELSVRVSEQRFEEGGYRAMEAFLATGKPPRGILCAYDYMAIGAIRCLHDHGLRVPEDVAVIGMDNIAQAQYLNPSLSSIQFPTAECCRSAAQAMAAYLTDKPFTPQLVLPCRLHLRESSRLPE